MIAVPSPSWTLEWGLCLLTVGFCWWRYRGISAPNVVRMLLKKLEVFLLPTRTKGGDYINQREEKYFHGIPSTKSDLNPRRYGKRPKNLIKPVKDLNFYKPTIELCHAQDAEQLPDCLVCAHAKNGGFYRGPRKSASVDLENCLDCDTRAPHNPWYIRLCAFFVFFWRKRFIGEQYSMVKLKDMMSDAKVNQTVKEAAKLELQPNAPAENYEKLVQKHRQRTEKIVSGMRAKQASNPWFSYFVRFDWCRLLPGNNDLTAYSYIEKWCRRGRKLHVCDSDILRHRYNQVASWIIGKTLGRIYPQILVRRSQIDVIRKARECGNPIVYLPIHRSHVDYVLVSWILVACDIRAPLVAAGDNLNIPIFSLLMRSVGGFFIKRKLDCQEGKRDILYRAILHSYMTRTLTDDNDLEFFIEGGRTRTGKPCSPKGGLLSIVVDTMIANKVEDMLVVPVNFSYERLLDGNFIREQLGRPKVSESFASAALGLWNSLQAKFGSARIDFGQPFSLKEYIQDYQKKLTTPYSHLSSFSTSSDEERVISPSHSSSSISSIEADSLEQRELVNNLAKHVLYDGQRCFSMMSTNAIAFLLLNKYRKGVTTQELAREMELLVQDMLDRGYDVGISGEMDDVIIHGLTVLGPTLVRQEIKPSASGSSSVVRPVVILPNIIELAYYSNCLLPVYSLEAVIATSAKILAKEASAKNGSSSSSTDESTLVRTCLELCEILQHEFIFAPPCTNLEGAIRSTINNLVKQNVFAKKETQDIVYIETTDSADRMTFLTNLLQPILHTYHTAACVLKRIVGYEIGEKQLQMDILAEIKNLLQHDMLPYGESLTLDPIRNFIKLMVDWDVLDSYKFDRNAIYHLHDHFDSAETMREVIERVKRFRL